MIRDGCSIHPLGASEKRKETKMAASASEKSVYVVLVEDHEGNYAYSAHFNKDDADKTAEEQDGKVLTTNLHINYTRV
jgi:hypothetical protein